VSPGERCLGAIPLDAHGVTASIDPVGAGLRCLEVNGRALIESYGPTQAAQVGVGAPFAAGATLFPWPNRVRDGRWSWAGVEQQLVVTEPERATANHGLVRDREFQLLSRAPGTVVLGIEVGPDPGFPCALSLMITYTLLPDGLRIEYVVDNLGSEPAPFALGAHPYLRVGDAGADDLVLHIDAGTALELDDRFLPVGRRPVRGTVDDPAGLALAGVDLNHCYGDLEPAPDGGFRHRLLGRDGAGVELRTDDRFGWVQVYTADDFPRAGGAARAVAIEPMTAPPDALNSGDGLTTLQPGESWRAAWSLHTVVAPAGSSISTA